ncbi:sensor histidine kinase [Paenibacillus harenae]|uniref:sensor histidine kinase n=1 Tax=Paenibacillus harenae TaxID=306543 RepID=UPI0003F57631|nr:sensor histidine kinase [Paenibacillus harenae]
MSGLAKERQTNDPSSYFLLTIIRLSYFLVLSLMYLFIKFPAPAWVNFYIIGSMVLFVPIHFLYPKVHNKRIIFLVASIDIAITTSYSYVFLNEESPDLLFMGLSSLFLFMFVQSRLAKAIWYVYFGTNILVLILIQLHKYGDIESAYYIVNGSFVVFAGLIGSLIRYYKESRIQTVRLNEKLETSYRQLSEYALQVKELSVNRERIRIAREIHDTVGHNLTALLIQLDVARKLQEIDFEKSRVSLQQCEHLVRSALREVRLAVRTIRDEDNGLSVAETVAKLAEQFAEMTGIRIEVHVDPQLPAVSAHLQLTLIRIVQESLTNAQKHGEASEAWVTLRYVERRIDLRILNNGAGHPEFTPGFGLINMRERVQEHGGILRILSAPEDGFEVRVTIPLD